jgi:hypothetical protein
LQVVFVCFSLISHTLLLFLRFHMAYQSSYIWHKYHILFKNGSRNTNIGLKLQKDDLVGLDIVFFTWFPCGRGRTLFILGSLGQRSPLLYTDFPKLAEKLSVIRTERHENLVRPKNILPVRKKSPETHTIKDITYTILNNTEKLKLNYFNLYKNLR